MRSTTAVYLLFASWALASREGSTLLCGWEADFAWNQN